MFARALKRENWRRAFLLAALVVGVGLFAGGALAQTEVGKGGQGDRSAGGKGEADTPHTVDAFVFLQPGAAGNCPAPANGGTTQVGCRFVLDLMVNLGSNTDGSAQQSYLTYTFQNIQNGRVSSIATNCTLINTVTADTCGGTPGCTPGPGTVGFDAILENEVCNGPNPCVFRGLNVDPGSIGYASGALSNDPQRGVFRVAQIGICAVALGQATLRWQFSAGSLTVAILARLLHAIPKS